MKISVIILSLLLAIPAVAQEPDIKAQVIDGKQYICFTVPDSQTLLQMRIDCPKLKLELDEFKKLVGLKDQEIIAINGLNLNLKEQVSTYQTENIRLTEEISDLNKWWRSPYLWTAVGVVLGAGLAVGIFYAVENP